MLKTEPNTEKNMKLKFAAAFFVLLILNSLIFAQNNLNDFIEQITEESVRDWFYRSTDPSWDPLKFHHGKNREEGSSGHDSAKTFIQLSMEDYLGVENVYIDEFPWSDGTDGKGYNIIGIKYGQDTLNSDIWVVGAHYDAYDKDHTNTAPGANDNGSGIVGVLEMARVINTRESDATILFCLWDAEEPRRSNHSWHSAACFGSSSYSGPSGSRAWINDHFTTNPAEAGDDILLWSRIKGNINLDMFGYPDDEYTIWLYHGGSEWNSSIDQSEISYPEIEAVNALYVTAESYLEDYGYDDRNPRNYLTVLGKGKLEYSDHISFSRAGIPSLEYAESSWSSDPHYHKWSDYYRPSSGDLNFDDENPQCGIMSMVIRGALALLTDTAGVKLTSDTPTPVELINFCARSLNKHVCLSWQTASETENMGFLLERREGYDKEWQIIADYLHDPELAGQGYSSLTKEYSFQDSNVTMGRSYEYRLSEVDFNSKITDLKSTSVFYVSNATELVTNGHAYPNPFNPLVNIEYDLPEAARVSVHVYDIKGNHVMTLLNETTYNAGIHMITWNADRFPSGAYLLRLNAVYNDHVRHSKVFKLLLNK